MNFLGSFLSTLKPRCDDDVVDRLNYYYTTIIILVLAITISAKQYVGQPIQCWVPAQFTGAWEQYAENYCFVQNTYWLPLEQQIPLDPAIRQTAQIGYYQWVPFVLAIEACFFYVPCVVWRLLNWQSGIHVDAVVTMAADAKNIGTESRERSVATIARHVEDAIDLQRDLGAHAAASLPRSLLRCGKTQGAYVSSLYCLVKCLYLGNVVGQFFLLNDFLGPKQHFWGAEILADLARGREWEESGHFPRVTMCDFQVRVLGNNHRYTIQCVLMINMFNEKIFLFLWWWYMVVAVATVVNLIYWVGSTVAAGRQTAWVVRYLRVAESVPPSERRLAGRFVEHALRRDGVFILRMIANHAGDLMATQIMAALYASFRAKLSQLYKPSLLAHDDGFPLLVSKAPPPPPPPQRPQRSPQNSPLPQPPYTSSV